MNTLAINTVGDELEASAEYCRSKEIGLEVTAFAFPRNLDGDMPALLERHHNAVAGITPLLAHGPFLDLVATSPDPAIVAVAKQRHEAALDAAGSLGASLYIAHTNFTPMIRNPSYRKNWTTRMLDFWLPFADAARERGVVICLENLWEPTPDIQTDLIASGQHQHLKASFDNGHALVFSEVSASSWIETLGDALAHCHLHDNSGKLDEHEPIGEGTEDWQRLVASIRTHAPQAFLVAESDALDKNTLSIERLESF
jgi:sugar phosphate isomerase/epimerase